MLNLPYVCQFGTPRLADQFVAGTLQLAEDPRWSATGAPNRQAYATWARNWCGLAGLRSYLLHHLDSDTPSLFELTQLAVQHGAYRVTPDGIMGLIYAPACSMLRAEYGIHATVATELDGSDLAALLSTNVLLCSVNQSLRTDHVRAGNGGHLVLALSRDRDQVVFHDPSGSWPDRQSLATADTQSFDTAFAGRAIILPCSK